MNYCHQGWTTPDRSFLFANDELDEINGAVATTRTLIFNISDLNNPTLAGTHSSGLPATDHNLYVDDCIVYEANYKSGLRILNISNPLTPVEVGFFDTFPADDGVGTDALWSVYPYFPSGTVILSDLIRGLFIIDTSAAVAASATVIAGLMCPPPIVPTV